MFKARTCDNWNHTASVMALLANCHRDPKRSREFEPADFHPDKKRTDVVVTGAEAWDILRHAFGKGPK